MTDKTNPKLCAVILLCVTALLCTFVLCNSVIHYKAIPRGSGITATGSASLDFESDLIVWRGRFWVDAHSLDAAYKKLYSDAELVKQYLEEEEIREDEMLFGSVGIERKTGQAVARKGKLATANLGVFQITALHSGTGDYGATGTLDTSSRYKTAMITVKLNYGVK